MSYYNFAWESGDISRRIQKSYVTGLDSGRANAMKESEGFHKNINKVDNEIIIHSMEIAKKSDMRSKHGCIIVDNKGTIISKACNKTIFTSNDKIKQYNIAREAKSRVAMLDSGRENAMKDHNIAREAKSNVEWLDSGIENDMKESSHCRVGLRLNSGYSGYSNRRSPKNIKISYHAEENALRNVDPKKLCGARLYVFRWTNIDTKPNCMNSKPCKQCTVIIESCMKKFGLKTVYYSSDKEEQI